MLKKVFMALGREKLLDLLIVAFEALQEIDIDKDSQRDEQFFDFILALLHAAKSG